MHIDCAPKSIGYWVVVLTREAPPSIYSIDDVPETEMRVDGHNLRDAGLGDWLGFYDWLRDNPKRAIGIRLGLDEENVHALAIGECMGVMMGRDDKEISIYFSMNREFEKSLSDDQDFGGNRLFVGSGMYAITFNSPVAK